MRLCLCLYLYSSWFVHSLSCFRRNAFMRDRFLMYNSVIQWHMILFMVSIVLKSSQSLWLSHSKKSEPNQNFRFVSLVSFQQYASCVSAYRIGMSHKKCYRTHVNWTSFILFGITTNRNKNENPTRQNGSVGLLNNKRNADKGVGQVGNEMNKHKRPKMQKNIEVEIFCVAIVRVVELIVKYISVV